MYASNTRAPTFIKETPLKLRLHTYPYTSVVGDFNTPVSRYMKPKLNKEIEPTEFMNQMDLIDVYRTFHPNTDEYAFFSTSHRTFPQINHIVGIKENQ